MNTDTYHKRELLYVQSIQECRVLYSEQAGLTETRSLLNHVFPLGPEVFTGMLYVRISKKSKKQKIQEGLQFARVLLGTEILLYQDPYYFGYGNRIALKGKQQLGKE